MKICTSTCFTCISWEAGYSPALINICTFVAKCVNTRFLRNFCGRYLVDKMLCGRYLVDILGFCGRYSIFDKTPLASLKRNQRCCLKVLILIAVQNRIRSRYSPHGAGGTVNYLGLSLSKVSYHVAA